jgi:hypothetical protein
VPGDRAQGTGDRGGAERRKDADGGEAAQPVSPETSNLKPVTSRNIWRDGLWIGAVALVIITLGTIYQTWLRVGPEGRAERAQYKGDGVNVPSYGFDLSNVAEGVNPNMIVATGRKRDEVQVLTDGSYISVEENAQLKGHDKYVLSTDRVIGVELDGAARAYPIQIMQIHRIANDVLANHSIVVYYDPESEITNAFIAIGAGESQHTATVTDPAYVFGDSGLAYKGVSLAFDRDGLQRDQPGPSLWNMLEGRAIAGPMAGKRLDSQASTMAHITCAVLQWRDWLALHPKTTIAKRDEAFKEQYKKDLYGPYHQSDRLLYSVVPQAPAETLDRLGLSHKSRGIGIISTEQVERNDGTMKTLEYPIFIPYEYIVSHGVFGPDGVGKWKGLEDNDLKLRYRGKDVGFTPETVWVESFEMPVYLNSQAVCPMTMLYAWYAMYPETLILEDDGGLRKP